MGDIWFFKNDALGEAINIAARLQSLCRPGRICISQDIYHQVVNKTSLEMVELGKVKLKNITKEIHAFEVETEASEEYRILEEKNKAALDRLIENSKTEPPPREQEKTIQEENLQSEIIKNLKVANTRISLNGFQKLFKIPDRELEKMLNHLTDSGLLLKLEKENGDVEFGLGNFRKLVQSDGRDTIQSQIEEKISSKDFSKAVNDTVQGILEEKLGRIGKPEKKKTIRERISGLLKKVNGVIHSFIPGVIAFPVFAAGFYFLNMQFTPGVPWSLFLMFFMGTGLVSHFFKFFVALDQRNTLMSLPENPVPAQYRYLNQYMESGTKIADSFGAFSFFNMLFFVLNALTQPQVYQKIRAPEIVQFLTEQFPLIQQFLNWDLMQKISHLPPQWFLIPLAIWGGLFTIRFLSGFPYRKQLLKKMEDADLTDSSSDVEEEDSAVAEEKPVKTRQSVETKVKDSPKVIEPESELESLIRQCEQIKSGILKRISRKPELTEKLGDNMEDVIETHLETIRKLKNRNDQIEQIISHQSYDELTAKIKELELRQDQATVEELKEEYRRSIRQLIRQKNTIIDLMNQKEMNELKVTAAVTSLKQLELDLANMTEILSDQTETSIRVFEERARDLGNYVNNLKTSYRELDKET
jgi:hypothetical protein